MPLPFHSNAKVFILQWYAKIQRIFINMLSQRYYYAFFSSFCKCRVAPPVYLDDKGMKWQFRHSCKRTSFYVILLASFAKKTYICTINPPFFGHCFSQECETARRQKSFAKKSEVSICWQWGGCENHPAEIPAFDEKDTLHLRNISWGTVNIIDI